MYHRSIKKFPDSFMFAAATSAFQVEGAIDKGNRGTAVHDLQPKKEGITDFSVASDHYNRYKEDIALMKELGLDAYRFSISWVRILPDGKTPNPEGIKFYNELIQEIVDNGMEPIVTIYHFEYPQALVDKYGGWLDRESIEDFEFYSKILFENYGDRVKYWLTINEQDHLLKICSRLGFPETLTGKDYLKAAHQANYNMVVATARAIKLCHELIPGSQIAPVINPMHAIPGTSKPEDSLAAMTFNELSTYYITDLHCRGSFSPMYRKYLEDRDIFPDIVESELTLMKENRPDFLAMNYYLNQTVVKSEYEEFGHHDKTVFIEEDKGLYKVVRNEHIEQTDWGWNISPESMKLAIIDFYNRYELPIMITENGLGAYDEIVDGEIIDDYRIDYISDHLKQIKDCISMGFPVIGYCAWSFIDLVSGREGMDKRYGFVYVNRTNESLLDMKRIKKKSFTWYKNLIQNRGETL